MQFIALFFNLPGLKKKKKNLGPLKDVILLVLT